MTLLVESNRLNDYLVETAEIDYSYPSIIQKAKELTDAALNEIEFVKAAFEFVRDRISHSWDIQSPRITYRASDVLLYREGICYAKSNLLCALLRSKGVPTGFCYQRLTLGDTPDTGYCLHALNAVYLAALNKWVRLDARGNKTGIDAQFSIDQEQLAFPIRRSYDEIDYPTIYTSPNTKTIAVLKHSADLMDAYRNRLPSEL